MSPAATDLYVAVTHVDRDGTERYAYAMVPIGASGVVVHADGDALGMRASGSNSISLEGVELPESGVRGGFRAGDVLPYIERNLTAGPFHAAASLGIAEAATSSPAAASPGAATATPARACRSPTTPSTSPPPAASSRAPPPLRCPP